MTTTDTTTGADTTDTADAAAVEPQPAGTNHETASVDTEGTEAADASSEGASEVDEDQDDAADDGDGDGPGREAAKYRRRLRAAEAERDRLAGQVESLQRAEVERLAAGADLRPAALWASGPDLADLLSDDGTVDASKVSAAIDGAREQLGIPNPPPRRNFVKGEGRNVGRTGGKPSGRDAMAAVVQGRGVAGDD
ncbi:hypothetical protein ACTWP6_05595 [Mycobacterium sp. 4D054]|uniref:hypothetical protein n=1 Tax=Mycobacterium sp. 4D054 TaxID=3457440 RepID=UPI003FD2CD4D